MPVFAADVLPDTTGRNLGSPPQRWNAYLQDLDVQGTMNFAPVEGAVVNPSGVIYVATAPVTANGNTTASQVLQVATIQAGLLNSLGKVLRMTLGGTYTTQSGQTPTLTIAVALGNFEFFGPTATLSAGQTNGIWWAQCGLTVYTPGSSGYIDSHGVMAFEPTANSQVGNLLLSALTALGGPIDFTAVQSLHCACVFSTNTSPANSLTQNKFIVEILN